MNTDNIIIHKSFDMGLAPYRLVGFWSAPSINDNGYQNAMDNRPNECNCMCNHCGTGIVHHYIIKDAKGDKFSVGSSCINKLNDTLLIAQVKADKLARDKVIRREKVQAKRKKAQEDADYQREAERMVNGGLTDLEVKQKAILDAETIRFAPIVFILKPLAELLADGEQGFCDDISKEMLGRFYKQ